MFLSSATPLFLSPVPRKYKKLFSFSFLFLAVAQAVLWLCWCNRGCFSRAGFGWRVGRGHQCCHRETFFLRVTSFSHARVKSFGGIMQSGFPYKSGESLSGEHHLIRIGPAENNSEQTDNQHEVPGKFYTNTPKTFHIHFLACWTKILISFHLLLGSCFCCGFHECKLSLFYCFPQP